MAVVGFAAAAHRMELTAEEALDAIAVYSFFDFCADNGRPRLMADAAEDFFVEAMGTASSMNSPEELEKTASLFMKYFERTKVE